MKFDTVIIGGGLSGLICGIRLQQNRQKCIIVSTGHSALHFSSGSFDLYSTTNGDVTTNILDKVSKLVEEKKDHPYAKIGVENMQQLMIDAKSILSEAGISTYGNEKDNHYRITPMGKLRPTWLTQKGYAVNTNGDSLPWKSAAIFGIEGYLDFFPHFIADELQAMGVETKVEMFDMPILETLRLNPTGLIATSIARELDKPDNKAILLQLLKDKSKDSEVIILPACISMACDEIVDYLKTETGKEVILIPTLPPSVAGASMQKRLTNYFKQIGGVYMLGDTIEKADVSSGKVEKVYSHNHTDIPFYADNYILASGGFFSKGLIASNKDVKEPLFNLDVDFDADRFNWYNKEVFDEQEYQSFGVKSTKDFKAQIDGNTIDNLYVVGAILGGYNPIKEGTGAGVSLLTALYVADQILKK